jgi:hypothetical protein
MSAVSVSMLWFEQTELARESVSGPKKECGQDSSNGQALSEE